MAKIAFILLCHKDPEAILRQVETLTATGDRVAIHFDGRARPEDFARLKAGLDGNPGAVFAARRVKCGWGEWSLVEATLSALAAAEAAFPDATHFYMLSGDCMPVKSAEHAHAFLDAEEADYIESVDYFTSGWIKTGIREERLIYRHFFNERRHKKLFYASMALQRRLGLARPIPADLKMQIGSQFWCLRRRTVEWVLDFCRRRPDVMRFFRTTWIPDECFFQTVVRHLVPASEIRSHSPTFLMFTDYGLPVTFHNDHFDLLLGQDYLFARKISPGAEALKDRLGALWAETGRQFPISGEGRELLRFLTSRGRVGRRFGRRAWEAEADLGPERELLVLVCKKWHIAKRLARKIATETGLPAVEYLFSEVDTALPDLGGIGATIAKRGRHRRSFLRLLFDRFQTERLLICIDPAAFDILEDLRADRVRLRILEVVCDFSDDDLSGHARRLGLAGEATPEPILAALLPVLKGEIRFESERLRSAGFPALFRFTEAASEAANAAALSGFLGLPPDRAEALAKEPGIFAD